MKPDYFNLKSRSWLHLKCASTRFCDEFLPPSARRFKWSMVMRSGQYPLPGGSIGCLHQWHKAPSRLSKYALMRLRHFLLVSLTLVSQNKFSPGGDAPQELVTDAARFNGGGKSFPVVLRGVAGIFSGFFNLGAGFGMRGSPSRHRSQNRAVGAIKSDASRLDEVQFCCHIVLMFNFLFTVTNTLKRIERNCNIYLQLFLHRFRSTFTGGLTA